MLIGIDLDRQGLVSLLDSCLCSDEEMEGAAAGRLADPFAKWPPLELILDGGESEEAELQQHSEAAMAGAVAGAAAGVRDITEGAAELQAGLNELPTTSLAVVSWHAPWCEPCHPTLEALRTLAQEHTGVATFFCLDVEGSAANTVLAREKVLMRPESRRAGV